MTDTITTCSDCIQAGIHTSVYIQDHIYEQDTGTPILGWYGGKKRSNFLPGAIQGQRDQLKMEAVEQQKKVLLDVKLLGKALHGHRGSLGCGQL